jgi:uncharacterized Zn finger protein (UPF0148 family)
MEDGQDNVVEIKARSRRICLYQCGECGHHLFHLYSDESVFCGNCETQANLRTVEFEFNQSA